MLHSAVNGLAFSYGFLASFMVLDIVRDFRFQMLRLDFITWKKMFFPGFGVQDGVLDTRTRHVEENGKG